MGCGVSAATVLRSPPSASLSPARQVSPLAPRDTPPPPSQQQQAQQQQATGVTFNVQPHWYPVQPQRLCRSPVAACNTSYVCGGASDTAENGSSNGGGLLSRLSRGRSRLCGGHTSLRQGSSGSGSCGEGGNECGSCAGAQSPGQLAQVPLPERGTECEMARKLLEVEEAQCVLRLQGLQAWEKQARGVITHLNKVYAAVSSVSSGSSSGSSGGCGSDETVEEALKYVLTKLRHLFGCSCAGVRLRSPTGDFPYFITEGFSTDFIQKENSICEKDSAGTPKQLPKGAIHSCCLACTCG
eukprot:TRINITY_DN2522_c2_g1_i1.p2 TRINITY_DN2522_c2_g1~~TRINITY_DN2522_c2_g1_i1.p2  ORF type:complete len:298 (-),score=91.91 TRINITY_DN2522_c2_g1_i1:1777-2670(-)